MGWMQDVIHAKVYEPNKRRKGGATPEWIWHRFPIKGGISFRETMMRDAREQENPLYEWLIRRGVKGKKEENT